ncbi:MAG: ATP-binding cassette domain-containing protein [Caldisericaceae bacterium]
MLQLKSVFITYDPHTRFKKEALVDVNLRIDLGEKVAIVGRIGSGKSTLIEVLAGLIKPSKGEVIIDSLNITTDKILRREIVKRISVVFQYPEEQFFAETVFEEIAFGPRNLGLSDYEVKERVEKALLDVGLNSSYLDKSPFGLSGGEKRKIAIASIVAINPTYLILDEPTSNLDYAGKQSILYYIKEKISAHKTVIFVTHDMDEVLGIADRVVALKEGRVLFDGNVNTFFEDDKLIQEIGLDTPFTFSFSKKLRSCFPGFPNCSTIDGIVDQLRQKKYV